MYECLLCETGGGHRLYGYLGKGDMMSVRGRTCPQKGQVEFFVE